MATHIAFLHAALLLLVLLLAPSLAWAQTTTTTTTTTAPAAAPTIYTPPSGSGSKYKYYGCYNETTDLPDTARERALDGNHTVAPGTMTVQACLAFCSSGGTLYKFAGLEFSRECWCGNHLSVLAAKFDDAQCNTTCDGDKASICGGPLKLSVYMAGAARLAAGVPALVLIVVGTSLLGSLF